MSKVPAFLLTLLLSSSLVVSLAYAAGSGSYHSSSSKSAERLYNQGVKLMLDKKFSNAEKKFRSAIKKDTKLAEAHNNLAYTLRKQGPGNYTAALTHCQQQSHTVCGAHRLCALCLPVLTHGL